MSSPQPPFEMPQSPWFIRPLDRMISKLADARTAASKAAVEDPRRYHKIQRWTGVRYLVVLGLVLVLALVSDVPWWGMLAWLAIVAFAVRGASTTAEASRAYLSGWLEGRSVMIAALKEASDRGMEPEDWLRGEFERDSTVMLSAYNVDPAEVARAVKEED